MNEDNKMYENDEFEIDLKEIFYAVKKNIVAIILAGMVGGLAALLITKLFITPMYTAENSMLVLASEGVSSTSDLTLGSQLSNDYNVLITCRPVLETVIEDLELDTSYSALKKSISISQVSNTRVLEIAVEHADPQLAYDIVRAVTDEAAEYIADIMEVAKPKVFDYGVVPEEKTSPSTAKNTALGLFAGLMLCGGVVVLRAVLDDTIKSEEDIEKYLGIPTLSAVPDRKDYIDKQKDKNNKKSKFAVSLNGKKERK